MLGNVYYAKALYLRRNGSPGGWFSDSARSGGGPLIDLGVHVIDLVRYIAGNPKPVSVYGATFDKLCDRRNLKDKKQFFLSENGERKDETFNVEDFASAMVRFDSGMVLSVETSYSLNCGEDTGKIEIFGDKGGITINPDLVYHGEVLDRLADITFKTPNHFDGSEYSTEIHNTDWMKDGVTMVYDTLTNAVNWNANAQPYVLLIDNTRGVSVNAWSGEGNTKRRTVTIAVARDGDYFYTFVNGVYICCTTPEYYRDKDTVPGLFGYGLSQTNGNSAAGNINYLSGTDAQAKIKTLIGEHGEKIMGGYVYYADTPDNGGVNVDNSLFTNTYSAENGLGLNYTFGEGGKFISPYVFFDGNFTFEFTYKGTQGNMFMTGKSFTNDEPSANSQDPKFTADLFQLGYMYKEDSNQGVRLDIADNSGTDTASYQPCNLDTSEGVKFTVKRVLAENGAYYQLFAQSVKVPTQTATRVIFYTHYVDPNVGDPRANWDQPFIPIFYAENALGTFSHVSWTTSAEIEIPQNTETFDGTAYDTPIVNVDNPDRYVRVAEGNTSSVKGDYLLVIKYTATEDKQYGIQLRIGDDYNTEWSQWGIYVGATDYYNLSLDKTGADGGYLVIRLHLTREYENSQQFWIDLGNIPGQGNGEKPVINNVSLYKVTDQPAP